MINKKDTEQVSVMQASKALGVHHNTIYGMIKAGKLPAQRNPGLYMIPMSAIAKVDIYTKPKVTVEELIRRRRSTIRVGGKVYLMVATRVNEAA